jgi:hypothetical protein
VDIEMRSRKVIGTAVICGGLVLASVGLGSGVANAAPVPAQIAAARLAAFDAPAPLYGGYGPRFIDPRHHAGRGGFRHGFFRRGFDRGHVGRGYLGRGPGRGLGRGPGRGRFY